MSDGDRWGGYARPARPADVPDADGRRTVQLVVPGGLFHLTAAEALHLAGQLRGAVEHGRAEARGEGE